MELAEYKSQLAQIELEILKDPKNEEFLRLKLDLEELIDLYADDEPLNEPEPAVIVAAIQYKQGQQILAQYTDKRFHEAIITSLPTPTNPLYTVLYSSWGQSEQVKLLDMKPFDASEIPDYTKKGRDKEGKKRKSDPSKDLNRKAKKEKEDAAELEKTKSWQSFTKAKGKGRK